MSPGCCPRPEHVFRTVCVEWTQNQLKQFGTKTSTCVILKPGTHCLDYFSSLVQIKALISILFFYIYLWCPVVHWHWGKLYCIREHYRGETHLFSPSLQQIMAAAQSSPLTTHVLNTEDGVPAAKMAISLHRLDYKLIIWNLLSVGWGYKPSLHC